MQNKNSCSGTLYVVATPIGNLSDMTPRAIEILNMVDMIAAEDTRHSRPLLQHFSIATPMLPMHEHNEQQVATQLIEKIQAGQNIAIISDAGTPLINDPGYRVVKAARLAGVNVSMAPGCCAVIAALSVAGLPTDTFTFYGFLPQKPQARQKQIKEYAALAHTWVVYESSHRIAHTIADMVASLPADRMIFLGRELTKKFEQTALGTATDLQALIASDSNAQRGEFVLAVAGANVEKKSQDLDAETMRVGRILAAELSHKQSAQLTAEITGEKRNRIYQYLLDNSSAE